MRLDFNGNLVGRSTDTTRLDLKGRAYVIESLLEGDDGILAGLLRYTGERSVNDALGETLLAIKKNLVDELADNGCAVNRIRDYGTLRCWSFTRHYFLSFFAP